MNNTVPSILHALGRREISSQELVTKSFKNIDAPDLQGDVSFLRTFRDQAFEEAEKWDQLRSDGVPVPSLAGIPFSVKDNFNIEGLTTHAASKLFENAAPATADAPFLAKLRNAGAILVGQTNMTEFAYSGLGLNKHHGTPLSPVGRKEGMIAGGSTSGGAVSVAEGMSAFAVGSDTSGSCRIPAACCDLVGFRPSKTWHSIDGIIPLAPTFDVPGLLARSVDCIDVIIRAMSGHSGEQSFEAKNMDRMKFLVPTDTIMEDTDPAITEVFNQFLEALAEQGATVVHQPFVLDPVAGEALPFDVVGYEAYAYHRKFLAEHRDLYDPRITMRLDRAASLKQCYYDGLIRKIDQFRRIADSMLQGFDAVLMPTLPVFPPTLSDLKEDAEYLRYNFQIIRNTAIANHLDLPSICLPFQKSIIDRKPVSLQLIGTRNNDLALLDVASKISKIV